MFSPRKTDLRNVRAQKARDPLAGRQPRRPTSHLVEHTREHSRVDRSRPEGIEPLECRSRHLPRHDGSRIGTPRFRLRLQLLAIVQLLHSRDDKATF
jgi:hypothetical protein